MPFNNSSLDLGFDLHLQGLVLCFYFLAPFGRWFVVKHTQIIKIQHKPLQNNVIKERANIQGFCLTAKTFWSSFAWQSLLGKSLIKSV